MSLFGSKTLKRHFNSIAPFYNFIKRIVLNNGTETAIEFFIPFSKPHGRILVVGAGNDNSVIELNKCSAVLEIVHLDISSRMTELARKRNRSLSTPCGYSTVSFSDFQSDQKFDQIIMPFYLDLFSDSMVVEQLQIAKRFLSSQGKVVIVDFDSSSELGWVNQLRIQFLYGIFWPITGNIRSKIPDYTALSQKVNFHAKRLVGYENYQCVILEKDR